jgi:hypothetical protein
MNVHIVRLQARLHYYAGQRVYVLRNKVSESIGPQTFLLNQHREDSFPLLQALPKFEPLGVCEILAQSEAWPHL